MPSERSSPTKELKRQRLLKALRESEILRELSELLASSLDPTHILQVLVQRTTEVCDVERCTVWLLNASHTHFLPSAYHINSPRLKQQAIQVAAEAWNHSSILFSNPVIQQLLEENGTITLDDLRKESTLEHIADKFFVRSILLVALLREGRPVGMMSLDNPGKSNIFTEEQKQLARAISQQAAVAIDNARLYQQAQEQRTRAERLIGRAQSIYQVAMAVNSGKDLPTVLEIAAQHLTRSLNADGTTIALLQQDELAVVRSTRLAPLQFIPAEDYITPPLAQLPHCITAASETQPIFVTEDQVSDLERIWFHQLGLTNVIIVPLIAQRRQFPPGNIKHSNAANNTIVGFIFTAYRQVYQPPTPGQLAFAQDIATQCALAIDKANLLTEAHQAAELATERANTLDAVFNAMTEGIIVLDLEGKIILNNSTAAHFIGIPHKAEVHLKTYLQDNAIYTLQGLPMTQEDFPLSRALRGEHVRGERFITKRTDGSERLVEVNVAPLFDSEAVKIGIVSAFRDITEQIRVERRIRQALDTMLHAAEAVSEIADMREMLYRVLDMTMNAVNSERGLIQLYDQEQQHFLPLLSIGFAQEEEEEWLTDQKRWLEPEEDQYAGFRTQLLEGHATLISAEQCPDQSDILHHTMILAAPIKYNNHMLGLLMLDRSSIRRRESLQIQDPYRTRPLPRREFSIWDIAVVEGIAQFAALALEQARWQQEAEIARTNEATMRESNQLKDEFLAITAHEFRTPLTIILAYNQMMTRVIKKNKDIRVEVSEKLQESIKNIESQTHQLTNIVNTFLEVARLNRGQISLFPEEIDLRTVLQEAVNMHATTSAQHTISYAINQQDTPYLHKGDKARLLQIFANLLQNAVKYSPLGGPITVSLDQVVENDHHQAEVRITDQGIGIPPEAQPRLFERFYRAPNIEGSKARGVGLGLYVVAELLRLHGGNIRVESSGIVGEGSSFIFTLPLLES